jgi:beta-glucosidase
MLNDPEMRKVVGNFPLARLATFPGMPLTPADVADLRTRAAGETSDQG